MSKRPDPLAELLADLDRCGGPSADWLARFSVADDDPLRAAFRASGDPVAMVDILSRCDPAVALRAIEAGARAVISVDMAEFADSYRSGDARRLLRSLAAREPMQALVEDWAALAGGWEHMPGVDGEAQKRWEDQEIVDAIRRAVPVAPTLSSLRR